MLRPDTQLADVMVNKALSRGAPLPSAVAAGKVRRTVPVVINPTKLNAKAWLGLSLIVETNFVPRGDSRVLMSRATRSRAMSNPPANLGKNKKDTIKTK
jgi:hypothetical protein